MKLHSVKLAIIATLLLAVGVGAGYYIATSSKSETPRACTQEAKLCPDGSYVGRTGPNCEFSACPTPDTNPIGQNCSGPEDTSCPSDYTCIQSCGPPVAREDDPPPPYYCELKEVAARLRNCPICLASNTMIATPGGDVPVQDMRAGMIVWSQNGAGERIVSPVVEVSRSPAPKGHRVIHFALADGREVWVSTQHPAANGLAVGKLRVGDDYDGAKIALVESVPYWDEATYDLLPGGDTGHYWANGILLGSALKK